MIFSTPAVQSVYERYEARAAAELESALKAGVAHVMAVRDEMLLQVGAETGRLLHALILGRKPRRVLELGTSYGYSTLFLADAARQIGATVVTIEVAGAKQAYAGGQLREAGLADVVEFRCGDAIELIEADPGPWDFVLLDIWKDIYLACFDAFYPKLAEEALIVADNMVNPDFERHEVRRFRDRIRQKPDLQSTLLPIGSGLELTAKWTAGNAKL